MILQFIDVAFSKNKIKLEFNQDKNIMILIVEKILDYGEIDCKLK